MDPHLISIIKLGVGEKLAESVINCLEDVLGFVTCGDSLGILPDFWQT